MVATVPSRCLDAPSLVFITAVLFAFATTPQPARGQEAAPEPEQAEMEPPAQAPNGENPENIQPASTEQISAEEICARNYEPLIEAYDEDLSACNTELERIRSGAGGGSDDSLQIQLADLQALLEDKEKALRNAKDQIAVLRGDLPPPEPGSDVERLRDELGQSEKARANLQEVLGRRTAELSELREVHERTVANLGEIGRALDRRAHEVEVSLAESLPCGDISLRVKEDLSAVVVAGSVLVKQDLDTVQAVLGEDAILAAISVDQENVDVGAGSSRCAKPFAGNFVLLFDPEEGRPRSNEFAEIEDKIDSLPSQSECRAVGNSLEKSELFQDILASEPSAIVQFWLHEPGLDGEIACRRHESENVRWRAEWVRRELAYTVLKTGG